MTRKLPPILPVGTQVVTKRSVIDEGGIELRPAGVVAVIVRSPFEVESDYRIRFADGETVVMKRGDLEVLSQYQDGALGLGAEPQDLFEFVIYKCIVGSRAFGLSDSDSDVDIRGVYLPPARVHWALAGVPNLIEKDHGDECYWELERFVVLALKGNPNILECLYTPIVEYSNSIGDELRSMRSSFLSRFIHKTYNGYVLSQFKKLKKSMEGGERVKWKHAMHLIRLQMSAIEALKTGSLELDVGNHRDRLLALKRGEIPWAEVDSWRRRLQLEFDASIEGSPLPEGPDYNRVNDFLIWARRQMVD